MCVRFNPFTTVDKRVNSNTHQAPYSYKRVKKTHPSYLIYMMRVWPTTFLDHRRDPDFH